jgi:DNA mismatch repair protein MutS
MMKMGHEQNDGAVLFTYQLVDGVAEKSFACNVARLVGIPEGVIEKARERSEKMHAEIHRKKVIR